METMDNSNYSELCEEKGTQNLTSQQDIEEKPLICRICNIAFSCQHDLQRHSGCHEKKKTYKCDICAQKFMHKSHLNKHRMIHTGEKTICL